MFSVRLGSLTVCWTMLALLGCSAKTSQQNSAPVIPLSSSRAPSSPQGTVAEKPPIEKPDLAEKPVPAEKPQVVDSLALWVEYLRDETAADIKYKGKLIDMPVKEATVSLDKSGDTPILRVSVQTGVNRSRYVLCYLTPKAAEKEPGSPCIVRGILLGLRNDGKLAMKDCDFRKE